MKKVKLGDVCKIQSGGTPSRGNLNYWNNGNIPWVKISDIKEKYLSRTEEFITQEGLANSSAKIFPKETILYTIFATLGEVSILEIEATTNQAIAGLQIIDENICKDYLYYYLISLKPFVNEIGRGVAQNNINMQILRNFEIPLPSLEEQKAIARKLDKVSGLIEKRKTQLEKLSELVKSRFIEMFGDVINNDRNWPMATMGDVAEIKIGPFGTLLHKEDYIVGGHALVNPSHIVDGKISVDISLTISDEKYEELSAYHLKIDDIVLGRRGEMGRCAVVKEEGLLCGTGSLIIRPNDRLKPYFLQTIISNPTYKKIIEDKAVGVTMMNLNVPIVESLRVPMLPIALQNDFISFMEQVDKSKYIEKISVRVLTIFWQKVYIWK